MYQKFFGFVMRRTTISDDILTAIGLFITATLIAFFLFYHTTNFTANITLVYVLALVLTAQFTSGYLPGFLFALMSIICINWFFIYPYFEIDFTLTGYPVSFFLSLVISLITSASTTLLKRQADIIREREKLFAEAEKERMRANLLRAVSHDLRTPLTSIIGASSTYLENEQQIDAKEKDRLIMHIKEDANWLLNIVENLLSVTRIQDSPNAGVTKSLEPVEEVISEAVFRLRKRYPNSPIKVTVPEEFLMIPMDAILIEQVIINLLENALVHSHSRKPIECYTILKERSIVFAVKDYGIGIALDSLPHLFDGTARTSYRDNSDGHKGMGIGLSICKTILLAHGGTIWAENHKEGAIFYFELTKQEEEDCNEHKTRYFNY